MNDIQLRYASVEYKEPIVYLRFKNDVVLGAKEVLEIGEAGDKLCNHKPRLILTDARVPVDITKQGREVSSIPENYANVIANAVVVKWLAQRLIANVFMEVNKPPYPMRVFTDEKKAVNWLLEQQKKVN